VLQKIINDPEARELLARAGENLKLRDDVRAEMKTFVLSKVYTERADATCSQARTSKWHKLKRKSTLRLPPDDDSLNHHVERPNYITYCQLHYALFEHLSPIGHGWEILNGKCRPVRYRPTLPPLPQQITSWKFQLEVAVIVVVMMREASGKDHLIRTKNINSSVTV